MSDRTYTPPAPGSLACNALRALIDHARTTAAAVTHDSPLRQQAELAWTKMVLDSPHIFTTEQRESWIKGWITCAAGYLIEKSEAVCKYPTDKSVGFKPD
jgi:hypothetical protein